ncbi:4839_t:CDS:2 [Acaulospora colombiana]|uniref:4839_t:CDS:1 n=1 Tax=Acaulospora colombiana TaxID=27376 RepID=A0ACA9NKS0_9GLOM|nr:4839_t:CDS:2 [Acaulospora colombiana]
MTMPLSAISAGHCWDQDMFRRVEVESYDTGTTLREEIEGDEKNEQSQRTYE